MQQHFLRCLMLCGAGLLAAGCPSGPVQVVPGDWLFEVEIYQHVIAVTLLADHTTEGPDPLPPGGEATFGGNVVWQQHDATFILVQYNGSVALILTADVQSATSLSGTCIAPGIIDTPCSWSATRVE